MSGAMTFKMLIIRALLFIGFLSVQTSANGTTYVVFRYDDFAADNPVVRETDNERLKIWEAEKEIDGLFEKYGFPYVIAVIPKARLKYGEQGTNSESVSFEEDGEKIEFVKRAVQAGRLEVAQHGLSHTNHVWENNTSHRHGEFRERDQDSQLADIEEGKRILTQSLGLQDIVTFVPPWNGWDRNTASALKRAGFKILSSNRFYWSKEAEALTIIPSTISPNELYSVIDNGSLPENGIIVVLYHPTDIYEGFEQGPSYFGPQQFDKLLAKISVLPDVKVVTLQQLEAIRKDLTSGRFHSAVHVQYFRDFWQEILPKRFFSRMLLPPHLLPGKKGWMFYLTEAQYQEKVRFWVLITAMFLTAAVCVGIIIRYVFSRLATKKWCLIADCLAVVVVFIAIAAEFHLIYKGYHMVAARAIPGFIGLGFLLFGIPYDIKRGEYQRRLKAKTSEPSTTTVIETTK